MIVQSAVVGNYVWVCSFCYFKYLPEFLEPCGEVSAPRKCYLDLEFYVVSHDWIKLENGPFQFHAAPSSFLETRKGISDHAFDWVAFGNPVSQGKLSFYLC